MCEEAEALGNHIGVLGDPLKGVSHNLVQVTFDLVVTIVLEQGAEEPLRMPDGRQPDGIGEVLVAGKAGVRGDKSQEVLPDPGVRWGLHQAERGGLPVERGASRILQALQVECERAG